MTTPQPQEKKMDITTLSIAELKEIGFDEQQKQKQALGIAEAHARNIQLIEAELFRRSENKDNGAVGKPKTKKKKSTQ